MISRLITSLEKDSYNKIVAHPLQSYAWGEFREKTNVRVIRVEQYQNELLIRGFQITLHRVPHTPFTVGYFPKGQKPDQAMLESLQAIGKEHNCIFIKLEPNIKASEFNPLEIKSLPFDLRMPQKNLFTKFTFILDLKSTEEELLAKMKEKTRYNIRLAKRKGVQVREETSDQAFNEYLRLTFETTKRQGFYAHDVAYHKKMWETLHPVGIAHLFTASYEGEILVTWIVFLFNHVLYYPYGASSLKHREVMASNLMMWEVIKWGKSQGAEKFDMWGALPPGADPSDPRMGFHRFKEGYGPVLTEFAGSFDLVLKPRLYSLYQAADKIRWKILSLKAGH